MKHYTIGEIYRLGLLKSHEGKPYRHKATVSRIVSSLVNKEKKTPWGVAKVVSEKEIERHNQAVKGRKPIQD